MAQTSTPRIAVGGIMHESNTFSKDETSLKDFAGRLISRGDEIIAEFATSAHEVGGYIEGAEKFGLELVPTVIANATPAGRVTDRALDSLTDELIDRLKKAQPLDGLLLALHGAMVVESHADGDAEVLRRLRKALGDELPIVVTHDAHANVAEEEIELSTALVTYKEVPHIDQRQRGLQAAEIMSRIVRGDVKPVQAIHKPPLLYNILYHNTKREPMLPLVEEARRLERENPKILAVSVPVDQIEEFLVLGEVCQRLSRRHARAVVARLKLNNLFVMLGGGGIVFCLGVGGGQIEMRRDRIRIVFR